MNRDMVSIVLLAVIADSCTASIAINTSGPPHLSRLHRAAVDIAMTCYGDPGSAIGIMDDTDGSILKELRLNHLVPVVLINASRVEYTRPAIERTHKLHVYIIPAKPLTDFLQLMYGLMSTVWFNNNANVLILDTEPDPSKQCQWAAYNIHTAIHVASVLNVHFVCLDHRGQKPAILILTSNPFMRRASKVWTFVGAPRLHKFIPDGFFYARVYRDGGRSCMSINFEKTRNVGGYPLYFITQHRLAYYKHDLYKKNDVVDLMVKTVIDRDKLFMDHIVRSLNVSAVISNERSYYFPGITLGASGLSSMPNTFGVATDIAIVSPNQKAFFALTQHAPHKSQLEKILSDVVPAVLNLVRLTCNAGLTTLPQNVAPTIYLACLLMFVVTLQGIYTGNLAALLTTTISYPNVEKREDIAKLGYTIYSAENKNSKLLADPILDGHIIEIPLLTDRDCVKYVLNDPLAVCVMERSQIVYFAKKWNLHVSEEPILHEYERRITSKPYWLNRRIHGTLTTLFESGLKHQEEALEKCRLQFVEDDEVKKNTHHRVLTLDDLSFAFVILGVGLLCSLICFIGEIVIFKIRVKNAKRKDRVRVRTAWAITEKKCPWFPALNCRSYLRRLFSNHR